MAKLPGIKEVSVNLLKNSMVASYDESVLDTAGIVQAVEKAGYGAIPKASAQNKSRTTTPAAKPEVSDRPDRPEVPEGPEDGSGRKEGTDGSEGDPVLL